ncbi:MAG: VanW family protein [Lachnospiraceae bacterium]|nr:VanW family protein [Lachnospiraceae bacterium]
MKKIFSAVLKGLIISTLTVGLLGVSSAYSVGSSSDNIILQGVYAGNIPLGGYTKEQAKNAIMTCADELAHRSIVLYTVNDEEVVITPEEVGFAWSNPEIVDEAIVIGHSGNIVQRYKAKKDLDYTNQIYDIKYSVDREKILSILNEKCATYDMQGQEGALTRVDGQFVINQGVSGSFLDVEASANALEDFLCNSWTGENTAFRLVIQNDDPEGSYEQLSKVKDLLGSYTTSFKSSAAGRSENVANGASLINGDIIYPGEEYSFYDHIKPFTEANGYRMAAAYSSGKVVDSMGGGICQVSSTLYNAVLYSELEITSRRNHAMIVGYVDPARDATISEASGIDFKFRNNTDAPIYIEAYTDSEKQLHINMYGHETRPEGRTVEYESEIVSKTVPEGEDIFPDGSMPVGSVKVQSAHVGYKANLWKVVTQNGQETRELVNTSTYAPTKKYAMVGTATDDPNAKAAIENAMASGSIDTIKAVAASIKAGNTPSQDPNAEALAQYQKALEEQQRLAEQQQQNAEEPQV